MADTVPTVSVITPAFNASGYIGRALESLRAQTLDDWEWVVADDGSTDGTVAIVEGFAAADPRVRLVRSSTNTGPSGARNRAIAAARGTFVAVLDADDAFEPERLRRLVEVAEGDGADLVADNYQLIDEAAGGSTGTAFLMDGPPRRFGAADVVAAERPFGLVRLGLLKPLIRRAFLQRTGVRYAETIRYAEDFHLLASLLLHGAKAVLVPDPLYLYTLPRSRATGARSGGTRTLPRLSDRVWIAEDLLAHPGLAAEPATAELLRRYRTWSRDLADGQAIRAAWGGGRRAAAVARALARPGAVAAYLVSSPTGKRLRLRLRGPGTPPVELGIAR